MGHFSVILCINLLIHILCAVHGLLYQNVYHFIRITAGNSASLCFSEVHTALKAITLVSGFVVGGGGESLQKIFCRLFAFSKADTKDWMLLQIKLLHLFSCQALFLCCCLFTFLSVFFISHCQISYLHVLFCGNSVALEDVCWLFFSLSSLLLVLALICHAVLSLSPHSADLC